MFPDLPPARFDRPYSGTLIIQRVPAHETQKICGRSGVMRSYTNACRADAFHSCPTIENSSANQEGGSQCCHPTNCASGTVS